MADLQKIRWRYHWQVRHTFWRWLGFWARRFAYWCHCNATDAEQAALECETPERRRQRIEAIRARFAESKVASDEIAAANGKGNGHV